MRDAGHAMISRGRCGTSRVKEALPLPLSLFSRRRAGMELRLTVNFVVVRGRTEISSRRDWPSARMESWRRSGEILESWVLLGAAWPFAGTYGISDRVMMELDRSLDALEECFKTYWFVLSFSGFFDNFRDRSITRFIVFIIKRI